MLGETFFRTRHLVRCQLVLAESLFADGNQLVQLDNLLVSLGKFFGTRRHDRFGRFQSKHFVGSDLVADQVGEVRSVSPGHASDGMAQAVLNTW